MVKYAAAFVHLFIGLRRRGLPDHVTLLTHVRRHSVSAGNSPEHR
jgi:hypothetical protein